VKKTKGTPKPCWRRIEKVPPESSCQCSETTSGWETILASRTVPKTMLPGNFCHCGVIFRRTDGTLWEKAKP